MVTRVVWKQDGIYLYVLNLEYVTYICAYQIYTNINIYIYIYVTFIFVFP